MITSTAPAAELVRPRRAYIPAVGPRLKKLLWVVFGLVALLGANSVYLSAITVLEQVSVARGLGVVYQNYFYQLMVLLHLALGILLVGPLVVFVALHLWSTRARKNKRAIRMGYILLFACGVLLVSGFVLMRVVGLFEVKSPELRSVAYWAHVVSPVVALWAYLLHRLAGPKIKWRLGLAYLAAVGLIAGGMVGLHSHDPRRWDIAGPKEGEKYFQPSLARTATGDFIPARTLMMDHYCQECHPDVYDGWFHSAHRFSSFNNPAYDFSVKQTREVSLKRDGNVQASRWCAGCHDPVPFFSGAFDNPHFDTKKDPTSQAGITCTVCHSITHVNSTKGNADYTIEEPVHYPFAFSDNPALAAINRQLIKAKPALHKQTFLKPLHQSTEFCSACHKVHLPQEVTHYKEFLRGQNHYDSYLLSGVSGHGARAFYYPEQAQTNCNGCHMPAKESNDFAARRLPGLDGLGIHNHQFLGANTAITHWQKAPEYTKAHQEFLKGVLRVDIFGLKQGAAVDAPLVAPLRPELPRLEPGKSYLIEVVVRTLKLGHHFTQGTADSNEVWVEMTAKNGDRVIGKSGGINDTVVDPWSHFLNIYMLDRHGNRIDRRNAQDIFTPLYNNQIPPGAAQAVHFRLDVPADSAGTITLEAKVNYRKFDTKYLRYVFGPEYQNDTPITLIANDRISLPVTDDEVPAQETAIPQWQRWNDYGIAMLLEGTQVESSSGELLPAEGAFSQVAKLGRSEGALNLARVHFRSGQIDLAAASLRRAEQMEPQPPRWTIAWFDGQIHKQRGDFENAAAALRSILDDKSPDLAERKFDFSVDYVVINELGLTLFEWAKRLGTRGDESAYREKLDEAAKAFQRVLAIDSEDLTAHHNLSLIYQRMGEQELANDHARLHERYRPDDNARQVAVDAARRRDPAGNHASESTVIYSLHRPGAFELPLQPAVADDCTAAP